MRQYRLAITRKVPQAFLNAVRAEEPESPIDAVLAQKQHDKYVETLREYIPRVIEIPADEAYPDCCFVEDPATVINGIAIVSNLGHPSRKGEAKAMHETLATVDGLVIHVMQDPATVDGGDVLFTGKHIFIGLSGRSNQAGIEFYQQIHATVPVYGIVVPKSLHLKSVITALSSTHLVVPDNAEGHSIADSISQAVGKDEYSFIFVADPVECNVLAVAPNTIFVAPTSNQCAQIKAAVRDVKIVYVDNSELRKADSALTCCSILID
eukprot:TRINITY_DN9973_c0_g1_i1.p1 TRINITY_DN9973_c0_g1~~TRINITY_DN9973_c0_g1_i1.p1  ORF type:complete len:266 (+),score=75.08 TRINITY_DN9973_c0_g1_i1:60-857(+)